VTHVEDEDTFRSPDIFSTNTTGDSIMEIALVILSILCLVFLVRDAYWYFVRVANMEKRIADLEAANRQRLPYKSFEELLDAMAALDKEIEERKFQTSLLENVAGHIANAMKVGTKQEK
jgi:hypothetical protein